MDLFSFVKTRVSILDVVGEYATLKKAGLYWKGHCPFHSEKTASFTVSPHKEIFYCFGCNAGGDVISFIEKIEHCSAMQAVEHLIDQYGIQVPADIAMNIEKTGEQTTEKNRLETMYHHVATWCHQHLIKNHAALAYIKSRGLKETTLQQFMIGYFPGGMASMKAFLNYMGTHNILPINLIEVGLIMEGKNVMYSPFEERIIFPIKDHLGRMCGFGGRTFAAHDERAKYYNSRESALFNKGSLLYGFDQAKKVIQHTKTAYLVEGYLDCLMMTQHGCRQTVATLGTACTLEHLRMLARHAQTVVLLYDGDKAGQQAIMRLAQLCWQVDVELKVVRLPPQEDPASFLLKGFKLTTLTAKEFFDFFLETLGEGFVHKPLGEKLNVARLIIETIQHLQEPLKRDILLQRAAKMLNIPFESLKEELNISIRKLHAKQEARTHSFNPQKEELEPETPPPFPQLGESDYKLEKKVFSAILNNIHFLSLSNQELLLEYLPNPLRDILKRLKQFKDEHAAFEFVHFFETLDEHEKVFISRLMLEDEEEIDIKAFEGLLLQLYKKYWKVIVSSIKMKIVQAKKDGHDEKVEKIVNDFTDLKKKLLTKVL